MPHPEQPGDDPEAQGWLVREAFSFVGLFTDMVMRAFDTLPARRPEGVRGRPFVVCCLCAKGTHRSVAMKHLIARQLRGRTFHRVEVA